VSWLEYTLYKKKLAIYFQGKAQLQDRAWGRNEFMLECAGILLCSIVGSVHVLGGGVRKNIYKMRAWSQARSFSLHCLRTGHTLDATNPRPIFETS